MYDAGDFKFLATVSSPPGQSWMGGNFVAADCILVWSGVSYKFKKKKVVTCSLCDIVLCSMQSGVFFSLYLVILEIL